MKRFKTGLLVAAGAGLLLGVFTGVLHTGAASAQSLTTGPGIATVHSAAASGDWTDFTVTLNEPIRAGGSIAASLDSDQAQVLFCTNGLPDPDYQNCGINGNAAVFYCPGGCWVGEQFELSALGSANAALGQSVTVAASGAIG